MCSIFTTAVPGSDQRLEQGSNFSQHFSSSFCHEFRLALQWPSVRLLHRNVSRQNLTLMYPFLSKEEWGTYYFLPSYCLTWKIIFIKLEVKIVLWLGVTDQHNDLWSTIYFKQEHYLNFNHTGMPFASFFPWT